MAIVFTEGFDYYPVANVTRKWTTGGPNLFQTGAYAGNCARLVNTTSTALNKSVAAAATYGVSFYLRLSAFGTSVAMLAMRESTTVHVDLRNDAAGKLYVTRNGTTLGSVSVNALAINTWYHVEIKVYVHDSAGTVEVRVNGTSTGWINLTGQDTRNAGTGVVDNIVFAGVGSTTNTDFDHIIIWDTSGSANNDFLGDRKILTVYFNADGDTNSWTQNSGANRYDRINETSTDDDTTYISSNAAGNVQLCAKANITLSTINAVAVNIVNRKDDASAYTLKDQIKSGGTVYDGALSIAPPASYVNSQEIHETDPATAAAWTQSGFNSAQFGVKQTA